MQRQRVHSPILNKTHPDYLSVKNNLVGDASVLNIHFLDETDATHMQSPTYWALQKLIAKYSVLRPVIFLLGNAEHHHEDYVLGLLQALQEDGKLPKILTLSGNAHGATSCLYLSNKIYLKFGSIINIHCCLTNPVLARHRKVTLEEIITPNVLSLTSFAAQDEARKDFTPLDPAHLICANPHTAITCYSLPGSYETLSLNVDVRTAFAKAIFTINHGVYAEQNFTAYGIYQPTNMCSNQTFGPVTNFYRISPVHPYLGALANDLHAIRLTFEAGYAPISLPATDQFDQLNLLDPISRREFITRLQHRPRRDTSDAAIERYQRLAILQSTLLNTAPRELPADGGGAWLKINFFQSPPSKEKETIYVTPEQNQQLAILHQAQQISKHDKYSKAWEVAERRLKR